LAFQFWQLPNFGNSRCLRGEDFVQLAEKLRRVDSLLYLQKLEKISAQIRHRTRDFRGGGNLKPEELQAISQKSCGVLNNLGPQIQWGGKLCDPGQGLLHLYIAPNEKMVREHASQGGFPANKFQK
jgi:Nickel responsive protein SCO4226-like